MNNEAAVAGPNKSLEPTQVSNAPSLSVGSGAAQLNR
jgi:hypothetical protein